MFGVRRGWPWGWVRFGRSAKKKMKRKFAFKTRIGTFYIGEHEGRYHPIFDDENLGSYLTAQQAAEDLAGGHTDSVSDGTDTSTLGLPEDIREWTLLS